MKFHKKLNLVFEQIDFEEEWFEGDLGPGIPIDDTIEILDSFGIDENEAKFILAGMSAYAQTDIGSDVETRMFNYMAIFYDGIDVKPASKKTHDEVIGSISDLANSPEKLKKDIINVRNSKAWQRFVSYRKGR